MSTRTVHKEEICPFTLEPCDHCCVRVMNTGLQICPFTLEPCLLDRMGGLHSANNEKEEKTQPFGIL